MKAKEAMVWRSTFPKPPINLNQTPAIPSRLADTSIIKEMVTQALIIQLATKAPGLNKISFRVLQMIWSEDKAKITIMLYHTIW